MYTQDLSDLEKAYLEFEIELGHTNLTPQEKYEFRKLHRNHCEKKIKALNKKTYYTLKKQANNSNLWNFLLLGS